MQPAGTTLSSFSNSARLASTKKAAGLPLSAFSKPPAANRSRAGRLFFSASVRLGGIRLQ